MRRASLCNTYRYWYMYERYDQMHSAELFAALDSVVSMTARFEESH